MSRRRVLWPAHTARAKWLSWPALLHTPRRMWQNAAQFDPTHR